MNIDEIKKNAPDGATHYDKSGDYWKINGDIAYFTCVNSWVRYAFNDVQMKISRGYIIPLST